MPFPLNSLLTFPNRTCTSSAFQPPARVNRARVYASIANSRNCMRKNFPISLSWRSLGHDPSGTIRCVISTSTNPACFSRSGSFGEMSKPSGSERRRNSASHFAVAESLGRDPSSHQKFARPSEISTRPLDSRCVCIDPTRAGQS